ncbi:unnamed protein product [Thelazia callipaeda]|uniref:MFS domain-containing protein n=1 Tax=Thelazia callipaeda TaxID=103827 RepID=A0A0N5DCA7_THECL|nr:unnamed protein product [Thelazia callipaeda]
MLFLTSENVTQADETMDLKKTVLWKTWGTGLAVITITAFGPAICITFVPFLNKKIYQYFMTFLVALGIGTLSGSTLFVLIPGAFGLNFTKSNYDLMKMSILLVSLYAYFLVDRLVAYAIHFRKMRSKGPKIHQATIDRIEAKCKSEASTTHNSNPAVSQILISSSKNKENDLEYFLIDNKRLKNENGTVSAVSQLKKDMCKLRETTSISPKIAAADEQVSVNVEVLEEKVLDPYNLDFAAVAWMIIFGSSANNFVDGISIGAAFMDSFPQGLSVGIAVIAQQLPQDIGSLAIMIQSGVGFKRVLLLSLIPNMLSYLGFILGILLGNMEDSHIDYVYAVSSGMYLYIFLGTLIPEIRDLANEQIKVDLSASIRSTILQTAGIAIGAIFMYFMSKHGKNFK